VTGHPEFTTGPEGALREGRPFAFRVRYRPGFCCSRELLGTGSVTSVAV
jgi:hypothetical protein